mmetsp:Transcript_33634/g.92889  ORF Transcript_33634/g.92889 Transcript_33634/m.92889 type:complete len:203 (+) Transcript_33634:272-880(+)
MRIGTGFQCEVVQSEIRQQRTHRGSMPVDTVACSAESSTKPLVATDDVAAECLRGASWATEVAGKDALAADHQLVSLAEPPFQAFGRFAHKRGLPLDAGGHSVERASLRAREQPHEWAPEDLGPALRKLPRQRYSALANHRDGVSQRLGGPTAVEFRSERCCELRVCVDELPAQSDVGKCDRGLRILMYGGPMVPDPLGRRN